jgi:D-alanyl-lipoteichoic acid acyltransferase DltB (MBOAT superfamily)
VLFPTADYALFFLGVFAVAWALRSRLRAHKGFLLLASYAFYAHWDWRFLPLLVGVSLVAFAVAWALQRVSAPRWRRALVAGGVTLLLSTLAVFKYATFAVTSLVELLELAGLRWVPAQLPELALPVGISFFVFHGISLIMDVQRGKVTVPVRLLDSLLYVAFFPQLVAGPILRASSFLPQLTQAPAPVGLEVPRAVELVVLGLAKKVLVANFLATRLVDPIFQAPAGHSGLEVLLGVYGYAAQIYCDFSGYTDVAIGSALLLGYRFPENFDAPYRAASLQDFWRRWHISLSSWLRDYLFIPLGGSRAGRARTLANLCVTMVLGGLWHGAAWSFVLWGALHGLGLVVHRLWSDSGHRAVQALRASPAWRVAAPLLTFHFVCLGWVFFRASSLDAGLGVLGALAQPWTAGPWLTPALVLAVALGTIGQWTPAAVRGALRGAMERLPVAAQGVAFALAVLVIEVLGPAGIAPFIYFQF